MRGVREEKGGEKPETFGDKVRYEDPIIEKKRKRPKVYTHSSTL